MLRSNVEWNIKEKKYASTVKISIGLLCIALFIACGASKSIDSDVLFSGDIPPLSPMGHFAIIGAATNKSIVIVDISNKKQTGTITFEKIIQGCAISPQDRSIWLTFTFRSNQKGIFKLNFDSKPEIVNLIPDLQGNLHFNHDGRRLYVTPGSEKLYIIDTQSNQLVETVSTITGNHGEGWAFFNASEAQNGLIALTGIPLRFEAVNEGFKVYSDYTKTFLFLLDEKRTVIPLEFVGGFSTPPIFSFDNRLISTLSKEEKSVSIYDLDSENMNSIPIGGDVVTFGGYDNANDILYVLSKNFDREYGILKGITTLILLDIRSKSIIDTRTLVGNYWNGVYDKVSQTILLVGPHTEDVREIHERTIPISSLTIYDPHQDQIVDHISIDGGTSLGAEIFLVP